MHALHSKDIWHRDLSPANVMLFPAAAPSAVDIQGRIAKLVDLGACKQMDELDAGVLPTKVCTRSYGAPEYAGAVAVPADKREWMRADIWSVGCLGLWAAKRQNPYWDGSSEPCRGSCGCGGWQYHMFMAGEQQVQGLLRECQSFSSWSDEGVAVMAACLQYDVSVRPSAEQLLGMPWFVRLRAAMKAAAAAGEDLGPILQQLVSSWN